MKFRGHSVNRRTLRIEIFCAHPLAKTRLLALQSSKSCQLAYFEKWPPPPKGHSMKHCLNTHVVFQRLHETTTTSLNGPLNELIVTLSLLQRLDHDRAASEMGSAIGRSYLALSCIQTEVGVLNRLVLNHLRSSAARLWRYSV